MSELAISPRSLYLAVCTGGAIGAVARFGVIELMGSGNPAAFPWDTLAVNWLGSLLIGLFIRYWSARDHRPLLPQLFFTTGILGGFTTFSTLSLDTVDLFRHDAWASGVLYVAATLIGGLLLAAAGYGLGSSAASRSRRPQSIPASLPPAGDGAGARPSPATTERISEDSDR